MPSVLNTVVALAGVLVVVGALTAGFGLYEQATNTCTPGSSLHITHLQPNETVEDTHQQDFENLSADQQTALRDELPVNDSVRVEETGSYDGIINTVVTYQDERYYIGRIEHSDCSPDNRSYLVIGGGA
ncbi:hypothetical protein, partial [Halomarina rubra]